MGLHRVRSENKNWSGTNAKDNEFFDFIPRVGPNGGRYIIDGFWLHASYDITVATAVIQGEDMARLFGGVIVEKRDGMKRWNLPGDASRIACYNFLGADRVSESADIAVASNNLGLYSMYIPMSKPLMHTPEDFALPADEFGKLVIRDVPAADLDIATSDATINSIVYYVWVDGHEEQDLQFHVDDVVKQDLFTSTTETVAQIGGRVQDLLIYARGASGGAAMTNFTDIRIEEPTSMMPLTLKTELLKEQRYKRRAANNLNSTMGGEIHADPFATGQAVPVILHDERTSCFDGRYVDRMRLNMTNTVASCYAITRAIKPKSKDQMREIAAAYGLESAEQLSVKTKAKTRTSIGDWKPEDKPYLPYKAPLKKAA